MPNSATRLTLAVCLLTAGAQAQSDRILYQRDVNGRMSPVSEVRTTADGHSENSRIIDGRPVPEQQTDEKVLRQDASGKLVERIVKTYAPTGQLMSTDRVVIEETANPGGSTIKQTTFRTDINGRSQEYERRVTETKTQGQSTNVETTVQNATPNGGFSTTERRAKVINGPADNQQTTETVYRASPQGALREELRTVSTVAVKGSQTTSNTATYEPNSTNGALVMRDQTVTVNTRQQNGSEVVETSVYGSFLGKADTGSGAPSLREAQHTERQVAQDGSITERTTVRRADLSNNGGLGSEQLLSEAVCKGKCLPDQATSAKPKDAASKSTDPKAADAKASGKSVDPRAASAAASNAKP